MTTWSDDMKREQIDKLGMGYDIKKEIT